MALLRQRLIPTGAPRLNQTDRLTRWAQGHLDRTFLKLMPAVSSAVTGVRVDPSCRPNIATPVVPFPVGRKLLPFAK
jgi:hypothetical protein